MASVTKLTKPQSKVQATLQVAAYCRVSTNSDEQEDSLANQQDHFKSYIQQQPNWLLHKIYYDNGIFLVAVGGKRIMKHSVTGTLLIT